MFSYVIFHKKFCLRTKGLTTKTWKYMKIIENTWTCIERGSPYHRSISKQDPPTKHFRFCKPTGRFSLQLKCLKEWVSRQILIAQIVLHLHQAVATFSGSLGPLSMVDMMVGCLNLQSQFLRSQGRRFILGITAHLPSTQVFVPLSSKHPGKVDVKTSIGSRIL